VKKITLFLSFLFVLICVIGQQTLDNKKQTKEQKLIEQIAASNDGTPDYKLSVLESYRKLQYKTSIYSEVLKQGSGLRLNINQKKINHEKSHYFFHPRSNNYII
jgi:hypothetical protein